MISTSDFRTGLTIAVEGEVYSIIEFLHVKPGKGGAFVRTKLRHLKTGRVLDKTFRAGEKMEPAILDRRKMQYLYNTGEEFVFMDLEDFDQHTLTKEQVGEAARFLCDGLEVDLTFHRGELLGLELPITVEAKVVDTDPGVRGDTATGGSKPATIESGAVVQVPLFINVGDVIRVDTRTGEYVDRVQAG
ncbi:MAG TPA: elongation factor P [Armatimonadetes bacterium]|nr:elongation factor P [Armatimonadota bacterium]